MVIIGWHLALKHFWTVLNKKASLFFYLVWQNFRSFNTALLLLCNRRDYSNMFPPFHFCVNSFFFPYLSFLASLFISMPSVILILPSLSFSTPFKNERNERDLILLLFLGWCVSQRVITILKSLLQHRPKALTLLQSLPEELVILRNNPCVWKLKH